MDELKENLKTLLRKAINNAKDGDEKGEWITINGTHVFIPEGKTAEDVIKEKGWKKKGEGKEKSDGNNENKHGFKKDKDSGYYMKDLSDGTSVYVEKKESGQGEKEPFYLEATHFDKDGKEIAKKQYHYDSMDGMFSKIDKDFVSKDKQGSESELSNLTDKQIIQKKGSLISKIATAQRLDQQDKLKELDKEFDAIVKEENRRKKSKLIPEPKYKGNDKLKEGSKIKVDTNWRGVNPKVVSGEIIGKEKKLGVKGDANTDYIYQLKTDEGKTVWVEPEGIVSDVKDDKNIKNGLSEIIKNCKPETEEDLKVLKGLKNILEEQ